MSGKRISDTEIPVEIADEILAFQRESRRYRAGLDHELTPEQVALCDESLVFSRALGARLLGEGVG